MRRFHLLGAILAMVLAGSALAYVKMPPFFRNGM